MATRVLSTEAAKAANTRMQSIINGQLAELIESLNREGQILSDANVWDGNQAARFRADWPQMHQSLIKAKEAVEQLRATAERINRDIMTAGGN